MRSDEVKTGYQRAPNRSLLHLMAIAVEVDIPLTFDDFSSLADEIPPLCYMQPSGPHSM